MTLVSKSFDFCDDIVNPIYRYGVEINQDINPIYVGLERSCPRDSKNVSYYAFAAPKAPLSLGCALHSLLCPLSEALPDTHTHGHPQLYK